MTAPTDALRDALVENFRAWMAEMTTMPADPARREAAIAEHLADRIVDLLERFFRMPAERSDGK